MADTIEQNIKNLEQEISSKSQMLESYVAEGRQDAFTESLRKDISLKESQLNKLMASQVTQLGQIGSISDYDTADISGNIQRLEQEKAATQKILKEVSAETDAEKLASYDVMFGGKGEFVKGFEKEVVSKESQIQALKGLQKTQREIAQAERMAKQPDVTVDQGQLDTAKQIFIEEKKKLEILTSRELAPYVEFNPDGSYILKIDLALQAGVSPELLEKISDKGKIESAQKRVEKKKESIQSLIQESIQEGKGLKEMAATQQLGDEWWRKYNKAIEVVNKYPYMVNVYEDGKTVQRPARGGQIDIVAAVLAGKENEVKLIYGDDTVKQAKDYIEKYGSYKYQPEPTRQDRYNQASQLIYGKDYNELSTIQKTIASQQAENIYMYSPETMPPVVRLGISMTPVLGTTYYWDQMNTGQKVTSIAMDALVIFGGYVLPKVGNLLVRPFVKSGAGREFIVAMSERIKPVTNFIKKANPELLKPVKQATKLQAKYIDDLMKAEALQNTISETEKLLKLESLTKGTVQFKAAEDLLNTSRAELANLYTKLDSTAANLEKLNTNWIQANKLYEESQLKRALVDLQVARFTAKTAAEKAALIKEAARLETLEASMSEAWNGFSITKYTREVVSSIAATPNVSEIGTAINRMNKLIKTLSKAKGEKAAIARADLQEVLIEVKNIEAGYVTEIQNRLISVREVRKILEDEVRSAGRIVSKQDSLTKIPYMTEEARTIYYNELKSALNEARSTEKMLVEKLTEYIKNSEKIYPEDAWIFGRGGVATKVKIPPVLTKTGTGTAMSLEQQLARAQATSTWARAAMLLGLNQREIERVVSRPVTTGRPYVEGKEMVEPVTTPEEISKTAIETQVSGKVGGKLKGKVGISEKIKASEGIRAETEVATETEIETKVKPLEISKTRIDTKTPVKTTTTTKPLPRLPWIPANKIIPYDEKTKQGEQDDIMAGAVAWYQGKVTKYKKRREVWWIINRPYKLYRDMFYVLDRPKDARVDKGRMSPYTTIQLLTGTDSPEYITGQLGTMKFEIMKPDRQPGKKGAIKFTKLTKKELEKIEAPKFSTRSKIRKIVKKNKVAKKEKKPMFSTGLTR